MRRAMSPAADRSASSSRVSRRRSRISQRPSHMTSTTSVAFGGIDQLGVDGVRIAAESRHVVRLIEVDHDEIGALARLERAGDVAKVDRARADARGHGQRLTRRQRRRVAARFPWRAAPPVASPRTCRGRCSTRGRRCRCRPRRPDRASWRPARRRSPASDCWSDCARPRRRRPSAPVSLLRPRARSGRPARARRTAAVS